MNRYDFGLKLIAEKIGCGKDNVISLATIAQTSGIGGKPRPVSRDVNAYYEDGVLYTMTVATTNKMLQIAKNSEVSFSVNLEGITGNGIGENLGWVLDPKNAELRTKLRKAFADWYDFANNESSKDCCILAIRITNVTINHDHGSDFFHMDFVSKIEGEEGKIK